LHRQREQYVKRRTALANQIRGTLGQYGIVVSKGLGSLRRALPRLLEDAGNALTALAREAYAESYRELGEFDEKVARVEGKLEHLARQDPRCVRLMSIPGIGFLTATAWVALLGDGAQFAKARQCAAFLGLVPRQHSSGGKERLLGISKRGDRYLRTLLVHGARAALRTARAKEDRRSRWIREVAATHHANVAAVALANRNARTAWALLRSGETYQVAA
jgi:transposase